MLHQNIVLIGMSAAGKSFIGRLLAEKLGWKFIDGDEYIEKTENAKLQAILDEKGDDEFLKIEEKRLLELLPIEKTVFSPGGSIVYSVKLMNALRGCANIICLDVSLSAITERIKSNQQRGIVYLKSKPLEKLFMEREILYKKYADVVIDCGEQSFDQIAELIKNSLF